MKYLRRQNLNPGSFLDDTVLQRADGNIELNPTQRVILNGDLDFGPGVAIPGPEITNVMYVTLDGDDSNSGYGEGNNQAKRTLKSALAAAQEGTTIFVRSGEYIEDNPLQVPPKVSIVGDNLRRTIIRPLNGTVSFGITNVVKTNQIVTITTSSNHGFDEGDRVRIKCSTVTDVEEIDVNIYDVPTSNTFRFRQAGNNISSTVVVPSVTNKVLKGSDLFHVNSSTYLAGMVFKGLQAPAYCINIDRDAIVDTSPYVQNCSNINGPWMNNGIEWLPFVTEQPDLTGTMVTGPRPLRDDEIQPSQLSTYGINIEGAGGGMLIDGDRYSSVSPIKSMVGDAFTQVAQGGIGFHLTNFGYMQLVSCFAVFCSKAFYATRGGYLSISNSVVDFGTEGFVADGYYLDPYSQGVISSDYFSTVGSITVSTQGSGFTSAPSVIIDPPTTPGGVQAIAEASIDPILGIINAISITDPGSGYDFQPGVTITPANGATAIANLSKNQTIQVNQLSAKPQVGSIMFLGADPTSYYVSATSAANQPFKYDEQKCRRDVGLIVNAVLSDTVFNSNYQSVAAGLSYLRGYASKVTSLQKAQTIAGLTEAKAQTLALTSNVTAQNRITSNFNTVINIINLGVSVAPSVTMPATTVREPGFYEAAEILRLNKSFIQSEITAWIAVNYPALVGVYDVTTSERDLGYVIDAMRYDLTYEGNSQTVNAAKSFLNGEVLIGTLEECLASYVYLESIIGKIVKNQTIVKSVGNVASQNTSSSVGSPLDPNGPADQTIALVNIISDVLDHGVGYVPEVVSKPNYSYANDPTLISERAAILDNIPDIQEATIVYLNNTYGGYITVTLFPPVQNVLSGTEAQFHNVSTVSTASTAMEYVGAGVTYNALPFFGGEPIPANERIEIDSGKTFTVTSDQIGNYRIGEFFTVNALTGEVTIDAENINLSGLAAIGPFKRNGIPVGVQLREVSNNSNLVASTGFADINTVPTQPAVQNYVENRYLNKVTTNAESVASSVVTYAGDLGVNGGDMFSTATTFNLLNKDSTASITNDGPTTVNALLNATTIQVGASTGTTTVNNNLEVKGSIVSSTQTSVNLLNTATTTVNAFGAATTVNIGDTTGTATIKNATITFPNATQFNINGASPTLASTSTGTLTLFDTLITTVNAFRSATSINIGESSGTLTIKSASTVLDGDLQVKGGDLTTNQTTFNVINTTATTVNAFGAATTLSLAAGSGTTTVNNNLQVNLNSTFGTDTTGTFTASGVFTLNLRDNTTSVFEIKEALNSYIKINSDNAVELITFGSVPKVAFSNTLDASSVSVASVKFDGGVGIAKKLYVGTDLNVAGSTTLGDDRTADTHTISGVTTVNVPDDTAIAFQVKENTQTYITAVTTNTSESVTIEATPKLLVKNATDNTLGTAVSGAAQFTGGVGIAKNATVGVDLTVNRDIVATGDLAVNGGDFTTTAATFNILNANATTINFGGAGTSIAIGAATGTTNIKHNLDVDGDVNIDGGDLTVSTATFNLANATATTINFGGAGTAFNLGASAGSLTTFTLGNVLNSGNIFKVRSTAAGTVYYTTDVTSGTVEAWQTVSGTVKIGSSGTVQLGTSSLATTTALVGGAVDGNTLKIAGTAAGTAAAITTDVTSGTISIFTGVTGNVNIGGQASTVNLGSTTGNSILEVRGSSSTGTATIRTNTGVATANVFNTEATTGNLFGAGTTVSIGAGSGTTTINNNATVTLDLAVNGGDITSTATTFNLLNSTVTTGNLFGAGTTISIGAATGTTTINNANTVVTGDLAVNGGDITTSATTFNLLNATATTVNFAGASTTTAIGSTSSGTTTIGFDLSVNGDVQVKGGDLTTNQTTFNLVNATATTVNFAGAGTTVSIGSGSGTTTVNNNLTVASDLEVKGGDFTVDAASTTFNLINTNATTVNAFGAATAINMGANSGTITIGNPALVGTQTTQAVYNTTATTVNAFGAATSLNLGANSGTATISNAIVTTPGQYITTKANNTATGGGQVYLNGATGNRIDFNTNGTAAPAFTTRSVGTKIVLYPNIGASATDYAFGIDISTLWASVPDSSGSFKWYAGTTLVGTLDGSGNITYTGDLAVNGGDITTTQTTASIFNTTATTVNAFGAGTTISIGAATGTTTINNATTTITGNANVNGGTLATTATTFNLINTNATTVNFAGAGTTIGIGAATGTLTIGNPTITGTNATAFNMNGASPSIATTSTGTVSVFNTNALTANAFGAATSIAIGANSGTITIGNPTVVGTQTTVNLWNTTSTTVNFAGAGTTIGVGATTGTLTLNNPTVVGSQTTVNLWNTTSTTVNAFGAATTIGIGAATGTLTIGNPTITGTNATTFNMNGASPSIVTSSTGTASVFNTNALTGNLFGAATTIAVGANSGTITIGNPTVVGTQTTVNLWNTTSTTVNFAGASTSLNMGAATGTLTIGNPTITGTNATTFNMNGASPSIVTTSTGTVSVFNTNALTANAFGVATGVNIATSATTASTLTFGPAITANTFKIGSTASGTINFTTDVTTGIVNLFTGLTSGTVNIATGTGGTTNIEGAGGTVNIGATTGDSILEIRGNATTGTATLRTNTGVTTANVFNTVATTGNAFGVATAVNVGTSAASASTLTFGPAITANTFKIGSTASGTVNLTSDVTTGIINAYTGITTGTVNIATGGASTTNIGGAAGIVNIGTTSGDSILEIRGNSTTGTATIRTSAGATTANVFNTVSTTGNLFGVATAINLGTSAAALSTVTVGPAITGNIFKIASTAAGTINLTTDVTSGTVNAWQSVTGTVKIGASGTVQLGTSTSATTTVQVGGAFTGNTLKIASTAAGTVTLSSDVTTGQVDVFTGVTTGTLNLATGGASTVNIGGTSSTVNIKTLTLVTDLEVQYGGTGQSSFTTNGVIYGQNASGLAVTAASNPGSNATTSYGVLTTDVSNVPVWTDTIDGGSY